MKKYSSEKPVKKRPGRISTLRFRLSINYCNGTWTELLDAPRISALLNVSRATAYKWINGQTMDPHRRQLLEILATGFLPFEGWRDWRIDGGRLISPIGYSWNPDELLNVTYIKQLNVELKRSIMQRDTEIAQLRAQLDELIRNRPRANIINMQDYHRRGILGLKKPGGTRSK